MRKIVVPVSFDSNSATAARYAASMGLVTGSDFNITW